MTDDMPRWEDSDERLYEEHRARYLHGGGFDALVDELMWCHGLDRDEAEQAAERRLTGSPVTKEAA